MASDQDFVDFVLEQIQGAGHIVAKKMFGEYGVYSDGKIFALVCNNTLYIKPTERGRAYMGTPKEAPPYPGAKNYFLIEDNIENSEWLSELVRLSAKELPEPKPKKRKKRKK